MYWPVLLWQWLQCDIAKCHFILFEVLTEHVPQGLGLLRAEVYSLLIVNGYLFLCLLLRGTEGEEKIPNTHAYLHAVGVGLTVIGRLGQDNTRWLIGLAHGASRLTRIAAERLGWRNFAQKRHKPYAAAASFIWISNILTADLAAMP